jgi:2-iminobutanoate/2-iminopropanoate deaminase
MTSSPVRTLAAMAAGAGLTWAWATLTPAGPLAAQPTPPAGRRVIAPAGFPKTGLPYSPGILAGDTLYLSGQLGRDPATAKLVPGGIEAETRQALANLRTVLQAAGMDFADVASVTVFIRSFDDFERFNRVYREHFPADPPARATVEVSGLNLGASIELQMTAVKPAVR